MMSPETNSVFSEVDDLLDAFIDKARESEVVDHVVEEPVLEPVQGVVELATAAATNFTNLLNSLPAIQEGEDVRTYFQKITSFLEEVFESIDLNETSLTNKKLAKEIVLLWSKDTKKGKKKTALTLNNITEIKGIGDKVLSRITNAFQNITTTYQEVVPEPEPELELVVEEVEEQLSNGPVETESESNKAFISWLNSVSYDDLKGVLFEFLAWEHGESFDPEEVANKIIGEVSAGNIIDLQSLKQLNIGITDKNLDFLVENLGQLIKQNTADSYVYDINLSDDEETQTTKTSKKTFLRRVGSSFKKRLAWVNTGADNKQAENKFLKSLIKIGKLTKSEGFRKVGKLLQKSAIEKIVPVSIDDAPTMLSPDDLQNKIGELSKEAQEELRQELEYIQKSLKDVPWQTMVLIPGSKRLAKWGGIAFLGVIGVASVYAAPVIASGIAILDDLRKIRSGIKNEDKNISGRSNLYDSAASKYSIKMPGKKDEKASIKEQEKNKVWKGRYLKGGSSVPMALLQRLGKIAGYLRSTSVQLSMRITRDRSIVSKTLDKISVLGYDMTDPDDSLLAIKQWVKEESTSFKDIKKIGLALTRLRAFGNYGKGDVYGDKGSRVHKVNEEHNAEVFERIHHILNEVVTLNDNGGLSAKDVSDWKDWYDEKSNKGKGNWRVFSSVVGSAIGTFATLGLVQLGQNLFSGESAENIEELEEQVIQQIELEVAGIAAVGSVLTMFENGEIPDTDLLDTLPEGVMTVVENEDGSVDRIFNLDIGNIFNDDEASTLYKIDADGTLYVNEDGNWYGPATERIEDVVPVAAATAGATATSAIPTQTPPFVPSATPTDVGEAPTAVPIPIVTSKPPATAVPIESPTATATITPTPTTESTAIPTSTTMVTPTSTVESTSTAVPPTDVATVTPLPSTPESEPTIAPTTESTVTPVPTPDLLEVHTLSDAEINTIYSDLERGILPNQDTLNQLSSDSIPTSSTSYDFDGDGNFDLRRVSDNEYLFEGRDNQTYTLLVSNTDAPIEPFLFSAGIIYNPESYTTAVTSLNSNIDQIMTALENGEMPEQSIIDSVPESNIITNDYGQVFRDINGDGSFDLVEDHHANFYVLDENSEWIDINDVEPVPVVEEAVVIEDDPPIEPESDSSAAETIIDSSTVAASDVDSVTDTVDDVVVAPTDPTITEPAVSTDVTSTSTAESGVDATTPADTGSTPAPEATETATSTEVLPLEPDEETVTHAIYDAIRGEDLKNPNGSLNVITKLFNAVNPDRGVINPDSGFAIPGNATKMMGSLSGGPDAPVAWLFSDEQMQTLAGNIDAAMDSSAADLATEWNIDIDEAKKIQDMFNDLNGPNPDLAIESLQRNTDLMESILELSTES